VGYAPERLVPAPPFSAGAYLRHHARLRTHVSQARARLAGDLASVLVFTLAVALVCARLWRRRE